MSQEDSKGRDYTVSCSVCGEVVPVGYRHQCHADPVARAELAELRKRVEQLESWVRRRRWIRP